MSGFSQLHTIKYFYLKTQPDLFQDVSIIYCK